MINEALRAPIPISEFLRSDMILKVLDDQLLRFLSRAQHLPECTTAIVERIFRYAPYIVHPSDHLIEWSGVHLLRVGDSVFNGHPKVGNGLAEHLRIAQDYFDQLAAELTPC